MKKCVTESVDSSGEKGWFASAARERIIRGRYGLSEEDRQAVFDVAMKRSDEIIKGAKMGDSFIGKHGESFTDEDISKAVRSKRRLVLDILGDEDYCDYCNRLLVSINICRGPSDDWYSGYFYLCDCEEAHKNREWDTDRWGSLPKGNDLSSTWKIRKRERLESRQKELMEEMVKIDQELEEVT